MNATQIQAYVDENIKYKDFIFKFESAGWGNVKLTIGYWAEDNFNPGKETQVFSHNMFVGDTFKDHQSLVDYLWHLIKNIEIHEAGEKFYVNGKLPFNEHNPLPLNTVV